VARRCRCCPLWYQGRGLGEPPEPRSRDRFRIDPTKATRL
jgi:hypothetical protein